MKDIFNTKQTIDDALKEIKVKNFKLNPEKEFIKTLPSFDRETGGFKKGEISMIAARQGAEKTFFILNLVYRASVLNKQAGVLINLGFNCRDLYKNLLCSAANTNLRLCSEGLLTDKEVQKMEIEAEEIKKAPLSIIKKEKITLPELYIEIESGIKAAKEKNKPLGYIVINNINLIEKDSKSQVRADFMADMARIFIEIARKENIAIILSCHTDGGGTLGLPDTVKQMNGMERYLNKIIRMYKPKGARRTYDTERTREFCVFTRGEEEVKTFRLEFYKESGLFAD